MVEGDAVLSRTVLAEPMALFEELLLRHLQAGYRIVEEELPFPQILERLRTAWIGAVTDHGHTVSTRKAR